MIKNKFGAMYNLAVIKTPDDLHLQDIDDLKNKQMG